MSRSSKKGYYVDQKLLEKIRKFSELENQKNFNKDISSSQVESKQKKTTSKKNQSLAASGSFKTWSRRSAVHPEMIGKVLLIHNGKEHKEVRITSTMVGMKLGALSPTRKRGIHGKAGKR